MNEPDWLTKLVDSEAKDVDGYPAVRRVIIKDYQDAFRVLREIVFVSEKPRLTPVENIQQLKRGSGALVHGRTTNGQLLGSLVAFFNRDANPMGTRHAILNLFVSEPESEDELTDCADSLYEQYKEILDRASLGDIHRDPHRPF
jgi:hypothetical protein